MDDMRKPTEPKSDQWNFDDFQSGPITFQIRGVKVKGGQEQPVEIALEGTEKFYRPCKSMSRCLVAAWGSDSSKYIGRSLTLYGDPSIKWGGLCVGGIRISHMSDIDKALTLALTVTRANRKPYTVKPIVAGEKKAAPPPGSPPSAESAGSSPSGPVVGAALVSVDQAIELADLFRDKGWNKAKFLEKHGIKNFEQVTVADYEKAKAA